MVFLERPVVDRLLKIPWAIASGWLPHDAATAAASAESPGNLSENTVHATALVAAVAATPAAAVPLHGALAKSGVACSQAEYRRAK
jgi:hypothetical protein